MNINQTKEKFPQPETLLKRLTFYSIMDVIMNAGAEYDGSVYHCNTDWNAGVSLFTIDDGGGDHFHVLFSQDGCIIKGFGHESDLSPYNYEDDESYPDYRFYENCPHEFYELLDDESLERDLLTFCAWHANEDGCWQAQSINALADWRDGSADFLEYVSNLDEYADWLSAYYETDIYTETLLDLYNGAAITEDIISMLNPKADPDEVMAMVADVKRAAVV